MSITPASISAQIAKGRFRPHTALTNMAQAYYQKPSNYFAKSIFPICRVRQSSDIYYRFRKEDLLRDGWQRKPEYGTVMPVTVSEDTDTYSCVVDQMRMGISEIRQTDLIRRQGPAIADPRQQRTKTIAEQANIHQDRIFAQKFMRSGVWGNELTGIDDTAVGEKQFIKWSNGNSDPIKQVADLKLAMHQNTGRMPNRMVMGANVLNALRQHPAFLERVVNGGTTANPASVTQRVIQELFEMENVSVMMSIYNQAKQGAEADMQFIGDPNAVLLAYATDSPSVEEPSAGYIFTWDMLGNGQMLPIFHYPGENGTHSEYVEGLMAYDMRKTADDLAVFLTEVV